MTPALTLILTLTLYALTRCKTGEMEHGPVQVDADALYKAGEGR